MCASNKWPIPRFYQHQFYKMQQNLAQQIRFLQFGEKKMEGNVIENQGGFEDIPAFHLHQVLLPYLLTFVLDVGIYFALYQYRRYAILVHACICAICTVTVVSTSLTMLIQGKFPSDESTQKHVIIGIIITVAILIQISCGIVSRILQCMSNHSSNGIFLLNRVHRVLGFSLALLCKIQVYMSLYKAEQMGKFWILLSIDIFLSLMFLVRKITFKKMQYTAIPVYQDEERGLKLIQRLDDISKGEYLLGVFANYVYNIESLTRFHPMGYEIIESIRGRDFDRYLYGSVPTERLPSISPNNHSLKSIQLLGKPIAKLYIPTLYEGLQEDVFDVKIQEMVEISQKGHMYEVRLLKSNGQGFKCKGYSSVLQIGRYFVLTLDNKISRLYITVSFLAPRNIELLQRIYFRPNNQNIYSITMNPFSYKTIQDNEGATERQLGFQQKQDYLPLFIKKYPGGRMTCDLIEQNYKKLQLSTQRGQGLKLYNLTPGKVVAFLGGTGIVPFGDLIDLLFKAVLIQTNPQFKQLIIAQNPILGTNSFQGFSFRFYLQEHSYEDIHPLTRAQLIQVSKHPQLLQFSLKCHEKVNDTRLKKSGIRLINEEMEEIVKKELSRDDSAQIVQYWICCSPVVNQKLIKIFDSKRIPQEKFVFL